MPLLALASHWLLSALALPLFYFGPKEKEAFNRRPHQRSLKGTSGVSFFILTPLSSQMHRFMCLSFASTDKVLHLLLLGVRTKTWPRKTYFLAVTEAVFYWNEMAEENGMTEKSYLLFSTNCYAHSFWQINPTVSEELGRPESCKIGIGLAQTHVCSLTSLSEDTSPFFLALGHHCLSTKSKRSFSSQNLSFSFQIAKKMVNYQLKEILQLLAPLQSMW